MSWLYSQVLVEAFLEDTSLDGEQCVQSSGSSTPQAYCAPDKMTGFSRLSRFGMTFKPLTESRGEELLTLYLEAFHAPTFPQQEKEQELMEKPLECGEKWRGSFTKYDPDTSLWRTHQCSLLGDLELFSESWPQWGLMRNGECWEQRTLEQTIRGTESGLLPNGVDSFHTPNTTGLDGGSNSRRALKKKTEKWPTPRTKGMCGGTGSWDLLNKNTTVEEARLMGAGNGGKLNPDWVEWLMNWPIKWSDLNGFNKKEFQRWQEASATVIQSAGALRTMWWDSDPSQTPFGQQHIEQSKKQHSNSLSEMSRNITRQSEMEGSFQGSDLSVLRDDIHIQKTKGKNLQSGVWEQACMDEAQIVPRTSQTVMARVDRLKAIGNGQVPLCAATAWRVLNAWGS